MQLNIIQVIMDALLPLAPFLILIMLLKLFWPVLIRKIGSAFIKKAKEKGSVYIKEKISKKLDGASFDSATRLALGIVSGQDKMEIESHKTEWADRKRPYTKRICLLSKYESAMLLVMRLAIGRNFEIFCNVRLADLVNIDVPKWQTEKKKYELADIAQLHVDFVICSKRDTEILFAVELDDPSHDNEAGIKRDTRKNKALEAAGIPLRRFRVEEKIRHHELKELFLADPVIAPLLHDSAQD